MCRSLDLSEALVGQGCWSQLRHIVGIDASDALQNSAGEIPREGGWQVESPSRGETAGRSLGRTMSCSGTWSFGHVRTLSHGRR